MAYAPKIFYVDELYTHKTAGRYAAVERLVRDAVQGEADVDVAALMRKIRTCQTYAVRKPRNGRYRAVVYHWDTPTNTGDNAIVIQFGVCTFTDRTGHGVFRKRQLRDTALRRYTHRKRSLLHIVPPDTVVTKPYVQGVLRRFLQHVQHQPNTTALLPHGRSWSMGVC